MAEEPLLHAVHSLDVRIQRTHPDLVAFLARRVGTEAEELAQEVWLRVHRAAPDCEDLDHFRAYAFTVARRLVIDHHRRRRVRRVVVPLDPTAPEPAGDPGRDPHGKVAADQILVVVQQVLGAMKPEVAEVFHLRTTTDLSFKAIAARQGCSLNTALGRHHHATRQLRKALDAAGLTEGGHP